jgi:hypothetical protein
MLLLCLGQLRFENGHGQRLRYIQRKNMAIPHASQSAGTGYQVVYIQPCAPTKPHVGMACNGCGVCCLAEPCPLGMLLSKRRKGSCEALRWDPRVSIYRCGAISDALRVTQTALPLGLRWSAPLWALLLRRMARRWIAAGMGCDSALQYSELEQEQYIEKSIEHSIDHSITTAKTP